MLADNFLSGQIPPEITHLEFLINLFALYLVYFNELFPSESHFFLLYVFFPEMPMVITSQALFQKDCVRILSVRPSYFFIFLEIDEF